MASLSRFIGKQCKLQCSDTLQRPSYGFCVRRSPTHLSMGMRNGDEIGRYNLFINQNQNKTSLVQSPCNRKIVCCEAASNVSGESSSTGMTQYEKIIETLTTLFPLWVILGTVIGIYKPSAVTWLETDLFTLGLGFLMLSMGLTLTFDDFRRCLRNPWTVGVGFLAQYFIKPLLGFTIAMALKLSAPLATGLILVSCCPGGQASNVATYISKGNVALSVLMTTCSTVGAIVMTPLLTKLLAGQLVPVDAAGLAISTFQVVLVPTVIGVLSNEFFPKFTSKIVTITPLIGVILTTLLCASPIGQVADVLKTQGAQLLLPNDYDRIIKNIERGEARISRRDEIMKAIGKKLDRYKNPWLELKIQYGQNKGKLYNEECDRFMICMVHKLGHGNWDELKAAFRQSTLFKFDWFVKSRTTQELARRCDALIRLIERENQEYDERERQARKEKKLAKNTTPSKRTLARQAAESPSALKKRKQLSMDDYVSSGKRRK